MPYRFAIACSVVALATLRPATSDAYYVEVRGEAGAEVPVRYADGDEASADTVDVTYRVNPETFPDGVSGIDAAIDASFATWTDAGCSNLVFSEGDPSDSTTRAHWTSDLGEIYVLVYFSDTDEEWGTVPAVGHFYYGHDGTGTLIGGTVVLNSRDHAWATDESGAALDVQSVVTALIGRGLGITSALEMNSTYPRYAPGDISKRMLGDDDLAAIHFLYPSGEMGCDAVTPPEDECDGMMMPGDDPCPPRPMTMPGDGGTLPDRDGGVTMGTDAGTSTSTDGGTTTGGMGDGCSCRAGGQRSPSRQGVAWLGALVLAFLTWRRRR